MNLKVYRQDYFVETLEMKKYFAHNEYNVYVNIFKVIYNIKSVHNEQKPLILWFVGSYIIQDFCTLCAFYFTSQLCIEL